jgi:hypothetical protein
MVVDAHAQYDLALVRQEKGAHVLRDSIATLGDLARPLLGHVDVLEFGDDEFQAVAAHVVRYRKKLDPRGVGDGGRASASQACSSTARSPASSWTPAEPRSSN